MRGFLLSCLFAMMAKCLQIRWTEKHWCSKKAFCLLSLPDHIKSAHNSLQIQGKIPEQKGKYIIYTVPMSDAENHSLQHESLLKMQSGQLYLSQVQNYSDLGISPALALCMRTFHGMQAHIPLTEITLFPHHQEQNYVNDIIRRGKGGTHKYLPKILK